MKDLFDRAPIITVWDCLLRPLETVRLVRKFVDEYSYLKEKLAVYVEASRLYEVDRIALIQELQTLYRENQFLRGANLAVGRTVN